MIEITSSGSFSKTETFLDKLKTDRAFAVLNQYGAEGVRLLAGATPKESGETANSWTYKVEKKRGRYAIVWSNTHVVDGAPIAILIQYGHGTGTGGWVEGQDYINPTLRPLFDKIADAVWREVTKNG